jgi:quinol monooxygenase YgiN
MITRIVKMTFQKEKTEEFLRIFAQSKEQIRQFPGCHQLELHQERSEGVIFFTYSYWESEESLNRYRESALFRQTWSQTKKLFSQKPQAWSLQQLDRLA